MPLIAVMTTVGSQEEAQAIARRLVERKLAACVQISAIESCYEWEGAVQMDKEQRLLVKTTAERYADVEAAILELHSYGLPAIVAFDLTQAHEPFAAWIENAVDA